LSECIRKADVNYMSLSAM